ncbi:MAG: amino acid ABC transporter permease [Cardiobacteriaceae bacterium]|nr:amino acid ABC transporter permease [Cardiobacteriaceae bacterium]
MDFAYLVDVFPQYLDATKQTLLLSFWGVGLSLFFGLLVSIPLLYRVPFLSVLCRVYVELSRNTPLLVQLFFLYFGLPKLGIRLSGFACGVIGLTFLGAAYMAEAFRGGIAVVHTIQRETAISVGLTPVQAFIYVIFPQSLAASVPALVANTLFLIKETSVVGVLAVVELLNLSKELIGLDYKTNEALLMMVLGYATILLPIIIAAPWLERRVRRAIHG